MNIKIHEAYRTAVAADEAWQRELEQAYGKCAGDARYDKRGVATPELARLHSEFVAVRAAYLALWEAERKEKYETEIHRRDSQV